MLDLNTDVLSPLPLWHNSTQLRISTPSAPSASEGESPCGEKQSLWRILFHQFHQSCFPSVFNSSLPGSLETTKAGKIYISWGTVFSSYQEKKKDYILSSTWALWVTDTKKSDLHQNTWKNTKEYSSKCCLKPNKVVWTVSYWEMLLIC